MSTKGPDKDLILNDFDYIYSPRYSNSIRELLADKPDGASDYNILKMLDITQDQLDALRQSAQNKVSKYIR